MSLLLLCSTKWVIFCSDVMQRAAVNGKKKEDDDSLTDFDVGGLGAILYL